MKITENSFFFKEKAPMLKIAGNYPQGLRVFKMVNDINSKRSFTWDNNLWRLYECGGEIHFLVKGKSANVKKLQEIVPRDRGSS